MSIPYYDAVDGNGLFDVQGKAFFALDTLNTARLTTIPTEALDVFLQFENVVYVDEEESVLKELPLVATVEGIDAAVSSWQSAGGTLSNKLSSVARDFMVQLTQDNTDAISSDLTSTLSFIIDDMESGGEYVDANAITLSLSADSDNIGDPAIAYTEIRGDGRDQENSFAEDIAIEVIADSSPTSPVLSFTGENGVGSLAYDWPQGSALSRNITASNAAGGLLSNGDFELTTVPDTPDDWVIATGTPGATIRVTNPEQQTITISGSPTGGSYVIYFTDQQSITRATDPLAFDATASTVEAALRVIPGLAGVDVSSVGISPNFVHTVVFTGVAGNPETLTSNSSLTGENSPAIAHAVTVSGDSGAYIGRALRLDGDGSSLVELYHELTLSPEVVYCCHFRTRRSVTPEESSSSSESESSSSGFDTVHIGPADSGVSPAGVLGDYDRGSTHNGRKSYDNAPWRLWWDSATLTWVISDRRGFRGDIFDEYWEQASGGAEQTVDAVIYEPHGGAVGSVWASVDTTDESSSHSSSSATSSTSSSSATSSSSSATSSSSSSSATSSSSSSSATSSSSSSSATSSSSSSSATSSSSSSATSSSSSSATSSSSSAGAAELRVELVEGIGGAVTVDKTGNQNRLKITVDDIAITSHDSRFFFFRTKREQTMPVYLKISANTAIDDGESVYIDEMAVIQATELYSGGPYVGVFAGATAAIVEDKWTLTVTNDRNGELQTWYERAFDMRSKGFLLPVTGSILIPDTVIG